MESRGTVNQTLDAEKSYTIQPGYYSGGKITANSLASQTSGTATSADIMKGKTAWVDGKKIEGSLQVVMD